MQKYVVRPYVRICVNEMVYIGTYHSNKCDKCVCALRIITYSVIKTQQLIYAIVNGDTRYVIALNAYIVFIPMSNSYWLIAEQSKYGSFNLLATKRVKRC